MEKGGYKPTFTKGLPASDLLPRLVSFHGGIRVNILPGDADCAVEGLPAADIKPAADK